MSKIKLSIVIPVYNNWNFTKSCLKDLAKLPEDHEVIIVDNGSDDATTEIHNVHEFPKNLVIHCMGYNSGFAKGCNKGYELSQGEYVLFLNNDIRVQRDHETWTQPLIEAAADGALVGPTGGLLDQNLNFIKETDKFEDGNFYMSGWCLCAKKEIWDKLIISGNEFKGPFSEEFGKAYFEDSDLSFQARLDHKISFKIVPVPVIHFGKTTSKKIGLSELYLNAKKIFVNKWSGRL